MSSALLRIGTLLSKTDKTRPWWVKIKERDLGVESHDHCDGECNYSDDQVWGNNNCYRTGKWWVPAMRCGCPICSDKCHRKAQNKKDRQRGRQEADNWEDWF